MDGQYVVFLYGMECRVIVWVLFGVVFDCFYFCVGQFEVMFDFVDDDVGYQFFQFDVGLYLFVQQWMVVECDDRWQFV